jgi:hypothetical protein
MDGTLLPEYLGNKWTFYGCEFDRGPFPCRAVQFASILQRTCQIHFPAPAMNIARKGIIKDALRFSVFGESLDNGLPWCMK